MAELLKGAKIVGKDGKSVKVSDITGAGKTIGLYFSAHWCPPCRGFTPVLAEFYTAVKQEKGANFEIVFVSSDRDTKSFSEYFGDMPWLALDFEDRDKKEELATKFSIRGIPTLVVVDGETGAIKDANGREAVKANPKSYPANW